MYTIYPILCGTITTTKGGLTYRTDKDVELSFPVMTFLITPNDPDDDAVILVDTGVKSSDDPYIRDRGRTIGEPGGGPEPIIDGLSNLGYSAEDVDQVILTHLHHDHSSNNDLFPEAEFIVHQIELDAANNPLPVFIRSYPDDNVRSLNDLDVTTIDDDYKLREGIDLVFTPGHSQGQISVIVETGRGPHALVADLAYNRHNLEPGISSIIDASGEEIKVTQSEGDYLPPGVHTNVVACYESMERVRDLIGEHGTIIPSHDPRVIDRIFPDPDWE